MVKEYKFAIIETFAQWFGGITAGILSDLCGIDRVNAQKAIQLYKKENQNALSYDTSRKRQLPQPEFIPKYVKNDALKLLDHIRGDHLVALYRDHECWDELSFEDTDVLIHPKPDEKVLKTILQGMREQIVVKINYHSKNMIHEWNISPNHLLHASNRYHVRAYCHEMQNQPGQLYLDYVLTRIVCAELNEKMDWVGSTEDKDWKQGVNLFFVPNPELSIQKQKTMLLDYRYNQSTATIVGGKLRVQTKKALQTYVEREFLETLDFETKIPAWVRSE